MTELITSMLGALIGALAAFFFTLRAQRNQLKAEIENTARLEIVAAINSCSLWIQHIAGDLRDLRNSIDSNSLDPEDRFSRGDVSSIFDAIKNMEMHMNSGYTVEWALRLSEYSSVFPYTVEVSEKLSTRQLIITHYIAKITEGIPREISETSAEQFLSFRSVHESEMDTLRKGLTEFQDLLIDLMRLVQNKSLGSLLVIRIRDLTVTKMRCRE